MGRPWQMPAGNLAMSALIRPRPGETHLAELGFVAALALHAGVCNWIAPARLQLKWPNDLLLDGAKLSGILLEREGDHLVLGIGVNVAKAPVIEGRTTTALADAGAVVDVATLAETIASEFAVRRTRWGRQGFLPIREEWLALAHPVGTPLWVTNGGKTVEGRFVGLDPHGALLLEGVDGTSHQVHAGDVWQVPPPSKEIG